MAVDFKNLVAADARQIFLNVFEFGEEHLINGEPMNVLLDESELTEHEKGGASTHRDGLYRARVLLYVATLDFGARPKIGALLTVDQKSYIVRNVTDEGYIYAIELEANRA